MEASAKTELDQFAEDVRNGLSSTPKTLSSKYFYDDEGSRLFREIMKLPEYYLTRAEHGILTNQAKAICDAFISAACKASLATLSRSDTASLNTA